MQDILKNIFRHLSNDLKKNWSQWNLHIIEVLHTEFHKNWLEDTKDIVIRSRVLFHDGTLMHSKTQYTTVDYSSQLF
jgi:hypothetical protein